MRRVRFRLWSTVLAAAVVAVVAFIFSAAGALPALATHIDGATHVFVSNDSKAPVPVRETGAAARSQPYQLRRTGNLVAGDLVESVVFYVPPGRRFVIRHATVGAVVPVGQKATAEMQVLETLAPPTFSFALTPQGTFGGQDWFTTSDPVLAYATSDTRLSIAVRRSAGTGSGIFWATLSGELVPLT